MEKTGQIRAAAVNEDGVVFSRPIKVIRALLETLGSEAETHSRWTPCSSQTTGNADGLGVHTCSLGHLESSVQ
jgi:hypothetical protein